MRPLLMPLITLPLLAAALPLRAADAPALPPPLEEQWRHAEDLARDGIEKLLQSLDALREAVPQYGAPYMDPEGNIIIPRRPSPQAAPAPLDKPLRS